MPSPNEIEILRITKEEMEVDKALISSRMRISSEYSAHLLNYLAGKNFLEKVPTKEGAYKTAPQYKLTRKGALILLARLHHTEGQYASAARRALYLKDVVDEKINELTDYIEEEFPEKKISLNSLSVGSAKKRGKSRAPASDPVRVK